jgi:hypothetical protein
MRKVERMKERRDELLGMYLDIWLENEARLNETGNDWSAPDLCSSDFL